VLYNNRFFSPTYGGGDNNILQLLQVITGKLLESIPTFLSNSLVVLH